MCVCARALYIYIFKQYMYAGVEEIITASYLDCCRTSTAEQATESQLIDLDVI